MHATPQHYQEIYPLLQKRINYISVVKVILSRWYWILSALIFGFLAAYAYLAYIPPLYEISALLKFEEKKSEISELINVRNIYDRTNKVESEKSVIRSRTVIQKAIQSLNYDVSFYSSKGLYSTELYPYKPFKINIIDKSNTYLYKNFEFNALGDASYQLCYTYQDKRFCKEYKYKQNISLPGLKFSIITLGKRIKKSTSYVFRFNDQTELFDKINKSLKFDETQNSSLVYLKITDNNPFLATDILNAILKEYLDFDRMQRSVTASQTASFISSLLLTMADKVKNSGLAIQQFKQGNGSLTFTDNLNLLTTRLVDLQTEKHMLEIEHLLISSIEKALNTKSSDQLTYNHPGITDILLNNLLSKYNELIIGRKQSLYTYTENSAKVKQFDQQIADLRIAINDNIKSQREHNNKKSAFLLMQTDSINLSLTNLPKTEREYINLQTRFDIDQKVYSYLAEKKLEAEISRAAVTPGAVIIDKAIYPGKAISPVPKKVYFLSAVLSFISSLVIIYAARFLNPYIYNKNTIEDYSKTPIIGIIRKYYGNLSKHSAFTTDPRSLFSESVRSVRSNLSFFASEKNSKIICITSEISGEGKSFISTNLAISLTLTEKKVLLIAADLRKSRLHDSFNISNLTGLSKFLSGQVAAKEIIIQTEIKNLDLITSGPVPPNPSELLHSQKMQDLLDGFKGKYDFILIDSAPIGLVTDGKPLLKMADITLFIIRSGISKRHFATTPDQLKIELGLLNIAIILNDYVDSNFHNYYYSGKPLNMADRLYYHSDQHHYKNPDYFEL
ncbi:polysaccharide biosynthesis tyrosine autokinase [Pedobacter psychroterrae]|uniref:non-specific protein-tyrosine kinase n=2 Tax=Pedobacter psychroterrae TaxID=2530453 RepID=A0A4R0NNP6_9SPHI|nr:polysaccharide biosynthesis tyrosine autokinase [Pedobacter psychroterrae]